MRDLLTTLVEVAGLGCMVVGVALLVPALGWVAGGAALVLIGARSA